MKIVLYLAILVGLILGPAYWVYGVFYSGRVAHSLVLHAMAPGKFVSQPFRVTPDMAPAGIILTAGGAFAPNLPDDQPPKVGYEARLSKNGAAFNSAKFALKAGSTGDTNPSFKERLFYLEAPQDGQFSLELEAKTPETIKLDNVRIEVRAKLAEPDGRLVSAGMVLMIVAVLILVI
jgi:hypothetical protein